LGISVKVLQLGVKALSSEIYTLIYDVGEVVTSFAAHTEFVANISGAIGSSWKIK